MKIRNLFLFLVCVQFAGCLSGPPVVTALSISQDEVTLPSNPNSLVCVIVPNDASFNGETYSGSGQEIAEKVENAIQDMGKRTIMIDSQSQSPNELCKKKGASLIVQTDVLHYEDNWAAYTGKPDRIELKVNLYTTDQPEKKKSVTYEAKSSLGAVNLFFEWGNASTIGLLRDDFTYAIHKLFR